MYANACNDACMEYQQFRIWKTTWELLNKVKALLLIKEGKNESLVEIVNRLVEAESKRLESKK